MSTRDDEEGEEGVADGDGARGGVDVEEVEEK